MQQARQMIYAQCTLAECRVERVCRLVGRCSSPYIPGTAADLRCGAADDEIEIRTLVSFHGKSSAQYILDITPLNEARLCAGAWAHCANLLLYFLPCHC